MKELIQKVRSSKGAGMIEYALLAALIGIALIVTVGTLRGSISTTFSQAGSSLT